MAPGVSLPPPAFAVVLAVLLGACAVSAQTGPSVLQVRTSEGAAAVLRGVDKVAGDITETAIRVGETQAIGRLQVTLGECRYPADNPAGDAFAYLVIREPGVDAPSFAGWMIASAPALNALEHPRYDIWVMRCSI